MKSETKTGWINIYKGSRGEVCTKNNIVHKTKEAALAYAFPNSELVDTIEITYEI